MNIDNVFRIGTTQIKFILKNGFSISEDGDKVLSEKTMSDGTERRNIAEKKKIIIKIKFTKIDGNTLSDYLKLMETDFEATYYSPKYKMFKNATFRLKEKPEIELIGVYIDLYEEFDIELESV